jgi:hypothetical protein
MSQRIDGRIDLLTAATRPAAGCAVDRVCGLPHLGVEDKG